MRDLIAGTLSEVGYQHVLEASGVNGGYELLRNAQEPYVVILDWFMTPFNGGELIKWLSDYSPLASRHAYILVTASAFRVESTYQTLAQTLNIRLVSKPFDLIEFLSLVATAAQEITGQAM